MESRCTQPARLAHPRCPRRTIAAVQEEVDSLPALAERVLGITGGSSDREWWFRGHAQSSWSLVPSLYRQVPDVATALEVEARTHLEFDNRSRMVADRFGVRDKWELLFLMQHHRLPTRLLDWSRNLLIGTFFAVEDECAWSMDEDPPCLFMLDPREWNTRLLGATGMVTVAGPSGVIGDLTTSTMAAYEPRVPGRMTGPDQEHAVAIAGPEFATRIVAQRGTFMVFGTKPNAAGRCLERQEAELRKGQEGGITKFILQGDPQQWKEALRVVGVGPFAAFPDLDGLARELQRNHFPS
jgi:hypothetical protein